MTALAFKERSCKVCKALFPLYRGTAKVCGWECAIVEGKRVAEKLAKKAAAQKRRAQSQDRKQTRAKLDAMRPLSYWVKQAQTAFNAFVRYRDISAGYGCIDCGKPFELAKPGGSVDAGHYLSRGSAPHLKFDERNVFAQRKNCNRPGGATRADFRAGVIARIGLAAVEALEADQTVKQYRVDDLMAIRDESRARLKAMKC